MLSSINMYQCGINALHLLLASVCCMCSSACYDWPNNSYTDILVALWTYQLAYVYSLITALQQADSSELQPRGLHQTDGRCNQRLINDRTVYRFHERRPTFLEVDSDVSIDCSPCPWDCRDVESWIFRFHNIFAMATKQPWTLAGGLCNLGKLQVRVYRTWIRDVDHLVERLVQEWSIFDHTSSVLQLLSGKLVWVCIKADRGHFEHFFMTINEWSHCFIGDDWTCSPCFHCKLCF